MVAVGDRVLVESGEVLVPSVGSLQVTGHEPPAGEADGS